MADLPRWDYWLYEELSNGTYRDVCRSAAYLGENDIRLDKYDLDLDEWCHKRHFFWTAQEAALITFFRDPNKVERTEDEFIFHDEVMGPLGDNDGDGKKNIELREHISNLYDMIREAQDCKELPRLIRREVYVEWCNLVGVEFPRPVLQELEMFEAKHADTELDNDVSTLIEPNGQVAEFSAEADESEHSSQEGRGSSRRRNSFLKIILALWEMTDLKRDSAADVGGIIMEALKEKQDRRFALSDQTITPILEQARKLYKN